MISAPKKYLTKKNLTLLSGNFLLRMLQKNLKNYIFAYKGTGCGSLNENPTKFKIVKEPLLIQK